MDDEASCRKNEIISVTHESVLFQLEIAAVVSELLLNLLGVAGVGLVEGGGELLQDADAHLAVAGFQTGRGQGRTQRQKQRGQVEIHT